MKHIRPLLILLGIMIIPSLHASIIQIDYSAPVTLVNTSGSITATDGSVDLTTPINISATFDTTNAQFRGYNLASPFAGVETSKLGWYSGVSFSLEMGSYSYSTNDGFFSYEIAEKSNGSSTAGFGFGATNDLFNTGSFNQSAQGGSYFSGTTEISLDSDPNLWNVTYGLSFQTVDYNRVSDFDLFENQLLSDFNSIGITRMGGVVNYTTQPEFGQLAAMSDLSYGDSRIKYNARLTNPQSVPDTGSTAMLAGVGLLCLVGLGRRFGKGTVVAN